jgi:hypothetical protein
MTTNSISLGWRCRSAGHAVDIGIRTRKEDGYKTCPFDMMVSNYEGLVQCIRDDFKYFCDTQYLELRTTKEDTWWKGESFIYHKYYKFIFNHESPGHANLHNIECWKEGINHYILNDYNNFCIRYINRINNFRSYIKNAIHTGNKLIFVLERYKSTSDNTTELYDAIHHTYPNLQFEILFIDFTDAYLYDNLTILMGLDKNSKEVLRLDSQ